jgi:predicted glycoside hydrolase/deacetylase ChbG (UPF0249 family)
MAARLIVNADDFGLTPGINRAVAELYRAGVLTSATLMANGDAFEDAVAIAHANPGLGVGCHVVLTDGVPVSALADIPTLVAPGTHSLHPKLAAFVKALLTGRIREADIATEALAQIRKLQSAGIRITHVDTHKHTHLFPAVLRPLLAAAKQAGVPAIRSPFEPRWADALGHGSSPRRAAVRISRFMHRRFSKTVETSGLQTTDGTLAISATGDLTAGTLDELLRALPPGGTYELCCHPGYNDRDLDRVTTRLRTERDTEREALFETVPRVFAAPGAPQLVHY